MAESEERSGVAVGAERGLTVDLRPLFQKLSPGPGLPADQVFADQHRRLHGALIAVVDEVGWSGVRVRSLTRAAGVSTSTFYKHFVNADDCLTSTYDEVSSKALRHAAAAHRRELDWRDSLRAMVASLMADLAAEPRAAQLALVDIFDAGPNARKRIARTVSELEQLVTESLKTAPGTVTPPRHLVAGMTAGMLRIARATTLAGRCAELPDLTDQIGDWMLALPSPEVLSLLARRAGDTPAAWRESHTFPLESVEASGRATADDRSRLLQAAIKLAVAEGFSKMTERRLRAEAGVSRQRFESCFGHLDECFLDAVETVAGEAADNAQSWAASSGPWERRTCRLVLGLCAQAARNRPQARLAFLGIFATGRTGLLRREQMIGNLAGAFRATVPADRRPSPVVAEASVAAVWHIAQSDIAAGRARGLPAVAPLLIYIALAPVIGPQSASAVIRGQIGASADLDRGRSMVE